MSILIQEDYEAWDVYPQHRWVFNKLELALKLGYNAGPACVPIKRAGKYIIRPTYNLYGMGIGAEIKILDPKLHANEMINHKHVRPGYFWCEYFDGPHYSIDYVRTDTWESFCTVIGECDKEDNLTRFRQWERIDPIQFTLPNWLIEIDDVDWLNVEAKGDKIIEIHLRSGNDFIWDYKIGTIIYPVWSEEDKRRYISKGYEFIENMHPDSFVYNADNHLKDIRLGYAVRKPN